MQILIEAEKTSTDIECYTCPRDDDDRCACYNQCESYDKDCGCHSGYCKDWE